MQRTLRLLSAFLLGFVLGCRTQDEPAKTETSPPKVAASANTEVPACCSEGLSRGSLLTAGAQRKTVALTSASVKEIETAIAGHKGNIVVLDIWADFCIPCKKEFPHLVEMHHKYGKDGVRCLSVTVDEEEGKEGALKFLDKVGAVFPNFHVTDDASIWQEAWDVVGVPVVRVYGRDGKLARQFDYRDPDAQFTYADVEAFVKTLLRK